MKTVNLTDLSTSILQAELLRRQQDEVETPRSECGTKGNRGEYNTPLHVFALILILVLSVAACAFPIVARRYPKLPIPHQFLFLSRHFGTGVLIATAFVHLFPTAYISLTDPCLPPFWNKGYPAMPGLIAMMSVFMVVGIEMFFASRGAGHSHGSEYDHIPEENGHAHAEGNGRRHSRTDSSSLLDGSTLTKQRRFKQAPIGTLSGLDAVGDAEQAAWGGQPGSETPRNGGARPYGKVNDENDEGEDADADADLTDDELEDLDPVAQSNSSLGLSSPRKPSAEDEAHAKKLLLQCLLLEAGILFHSIFIGIALSVSTGPPFIVLLIAISFHQTFEGLALGSRIAAIPTFSSNSMKPWLMALAYGTTTPAGQAIGLAIHRLYDPLSQTGLLMVGVMNAISSGLLLFAGLVELLAEDFLSDESYKSLKGKRRLQACGSVLGGAFLMAAVGAWA